MCVWPLSTTRRFFEAFAPVTRLRSHGGCPYYFATDCGEYKMGLIADDRVMRACHEINMCELVIFFLHVHYYVCRHAVCPVHAR